VFLDKVLVMCPFRKGKKGGFFYRRGRYSIKRSLLKTTGRR
jgi:hypothetical protein